MNRFILAALAAATFASAMPAAQAQAEAEADVEKRLEEAQQRLEAAAREVAELAAEAGGPHAARMFEMHLPLPARVWRCHRRPVPMRSRRCPRCSRWPSYTRGTGCWKTGVMPNW
jgi:Ni/Co efflux regulator RcnB